MIRPAYINSPSAPPLNLCSVLYLLCAPAPGANSRVIAISSKAAPWNQRSFLHFILPPLSSTRFRLQPDSHSVVIPSSARDLQSLHTHKLTHQPKGGPPEPFFGLSGHFPLRRDLKHRPEGLGFVPLSSPVEVPCRVQDQAVQRKGPRPIQEAVQHCLRPSALRVRHQLENHATAFPSTATEIATRC